MDQSINNVFPDLHCFSKSIGIPANRLQDAFEIEQEFHEKIQLEPSFEKRQKLYHEVYDSVHQIYGKKENADFEQRNHKAKIARLFRKELSEKSIIDLGCGQGHFLAAVSNEIPHKELVGLDVSVSEMPDKYKKIRFVASDVIKFTVDQQFDVAVSDNVIEHIAPADLDIHLDSVKQVLKPGGTFIIKTPNRLFGPSDVTRIVDFSYSGKTKATGTHLNESTYHELKKILGKHGFYDFRTTLPIPKAKHKFRNVRLSIGLLGFLEQRRFLMWFLKKFRWRKQCLARHMFEITLICRKGQE